MIETAQDLLELKAAIAGARRASRRRGACDSDAGPGDLARHLVTMLLGTDIAAALTTLESLPVDVIGLNCSTGPEMMREAGARARRVVRRGRSPSSPTPVCH